MGINIKTINPWSVFLFIFALTLPAMSHAGLDRATKAGMAPHKALYDIKLSSKDSSSKIANISGRMFYEWQPSCDAWISTHRFDMVYEYVEMPVVRVKSDFSTYESFDGKSFNFTSQRKRDDIVFEEIRGNVASNGEEYPNEAVYSIPEDLVYELPEGTLFPMAHTLDVLASVKKGQKFHKATIFDGSDGEGPVDITSFLGKPAIYVPPEEFKEHISPDLIGGNAWHMRLAFFPLNKAESTSDYEMSLILHDNGVISDMEIDYSEFSVTQKLIALEKLDSACEPEGVTPVDGKAEKK